MIHFLQRQPWAQLQKELQRTVVTDEGEGWQYQAFIEHGKLGTRLYCPYGPVVESAEKLKPALDSLIANAKKLGAVYLRIEPTGNITTQEIDYAGIKRAPRKQPEHTQRIDIDRPFAEVLAEMRKSLRNAHRNYTKKGLNVVTSSDPKDVEHLISLLDEVAERTGMVAHDSDYLRANANTLMPLEAAKVYLAQLDSKVIAAALVFDDEDCRYYAHAAADTEHRNLQAGSILVTRMIEDSANSDQKFFDLYGVVPPSEVDHPWFGFSQFKRSFGGEQFDYAGTWEIPVRKLRYNFILLIRKIFKDKF